jgi:hypothetical protein
MQKKTPKKKKPADHIAKGRLLEAIVAMMHDYSGVKVEKNVELPATHSTKGRKREIDVLLTSEVAGYTVRIPIACRNESTKVEVGDIGEFVDLLNDIGIPSQQAIFVSVKGFRRGALERAKELGIKTFVLEGLTKNRLAAAVEEAFQFFVYLLPEVTQISVRTEQPRKHLAFLFEDDKHQYCGDVLDLVVAHWRQGELNPMLGESSLELEVPDGWYQYSEGKPVKVLSIAVKMRIVGYVIKLVGETKRFTLRDAERKTPEKFRLRADFNLGNRSSETFEVRTVGTEDELSEILQSNSGLRIVQRLRLPRVLSGACFHPMSERVKNLMMPEVQSLSLEEIERLPPLTLEQVEEPVIGSIHEQPWRWWPVIVKDEKRHLMDVQLLMRNGEYRRVAALTPLLQKYPTPEFAELITAAHQIVSAEITGASLGKSPGSEGSTRNGEEQ